MCVPHTTQAQYGYGKPLTMYNKDEKLLFFFSVGIYTYGISISAAAVNVSRLLSVRHVVDEVMVAAVVSDVVVVIDSFDVHLESLMWCFGSLNSNKVF